MEAFTLGSSTCWAMWSFFFGQSNKSTPIGAYMGCNLEWVTSAYPCMVYHQTIIFLLMKTQTHYNNFLLQASTHAVKGGWWKPTAYFDSFLLDIACDLVVRTCAYVIRSMFVYFIFCICYVGVYSMLLGQNTWRFNLYLPSSLIILC